MIAPLFLSLKIIACSTTDPLSVSQIVNKDPTINIFSHDTSVDVYEGQPVVYKARVSDSDNEYDELTISWLLDDRVICANQFSDDNGEHECSISADEGSSQISVNVVDDLGGIDNDVLLLAVIPNDPPSVSVLQPVENQRYYLSHSVPFQATIVDAQDPAEELNIELNSSVDSVLNMDFQSLISMDGDILTGISLSEGEHELTLRVVDRSGDITSVTRRISVEGENTPPSCFILRPEEDPAYIQQGEELQLVGVGSDPDVPLNMLTPSWSSDLDGFLGSVAFDFTGESVLYTSSLSPGQHVLTFQVTDETGDSCEDVLTAFVNSPPVISIVEPLNNAVIQLEDTHSFEASVTDATDVISDVFVTWSSDIDGLLYNDFLTATGRSSFSVNGLSVGIHQISVTATDPEGAASTNIIHLQVNTRPVVLEPLLPEIGYSQTELVAQVSTEDDDGDPVTVDYLWSCSSCATSIADVSLDRVPSAQVFAGDIWTLTVTPNDGYTDGNPVSRTVPIVNSPPTISGHGVTPSTAIYNDSILLCSAVVTDPDETISPTFEWIVNGQTLSGAQLDLSSMMVAPTDVITCRATAVDSQGASVTSNLDLTVENRSPNLLSLTIDPLPTYTNDVPTCTGTYIDEDGEIPLAQYEWHQNGTLVSTETILPGFVQLQTGDVLECTILLSDFYGGLTTNTVSSIIQNTPPQIDSITFSPSPANLQTPLTCIGAASDPDGDAISLSFQFEHLPTGSIYAPSSSSATFASIDLNSMNAQVLDDIQCTVTATDSQGNTVSSSSIATIADTPPSITTSIEITPTTVYTGDVVTCTMAATDPEDGVLGITYTWYQSTTTTQLGTGSQYTISAADTNVGDSLLCVAQAADSSGNVLTDTLSVSIQNTPPTISSTSFTPNTQLYIDSVVQCSATITDPDETITPQYSWVLIPGQHNPSSSSGLGLGNASTLDLGTQNVYPEDTLSCQVQATDSSGAAATDFFQYSISNRLPTAPSIELSPSNPVAGLDDLVCSVLTPSTDDDAQTVSYAYRWYKNGSLLSYSANTINAQRTGEGEQWRCTVTPTDGFDDGPSQSDSVFILSPCYYGECDEAFQIGATGIDLVFVEGGLFEMGSPSTENGRQNIEDQHYVYLSNDLNVMTTEVTQLLFQTIMGYNPSFFGPSPADTQNGGLYDCGDDCPVEYVTWHEAAYFANIVTAYVNVTQGTALNACYSCTGSNASSVCSIPSDVYSCTGFRLPTEAEWEYLARAETTSSFWTTNGGGDIPTGSDPSGTDLTQSCTHPVLLSDNATYLSHLGEYCYSSVGTNGDPNYGTKPIATGSSNDFGLYDMYGNVREWTNDKYTPFLGTVLVINPIELSASSTSRVTRGGYWGAEPRSLRNASRSTGVETIGLNGIGFRLVQTVP